MKNTRIGIDTGGTFTDVVVRGGSTARPEWTVYKVPSRPDRPAAAVLDGWQRTGIRTERTDLVHGTTVGLNAVLTGGTARTAFVTGRGFRDLIEIGRQDRLGLYDLEPRKAVPPVPRALRFEIDSRREANGRRSVTPTREQLVDLRDRLAKADVDAIAIGLLHAGAHPHDEHEVARALAPLGVPITCSADLVPTAVGEYERFCAAVLNAGVRPLLDEYLGELESTLEPGSVRLLRSSALGAMPAAEAREFPARALLSGPAGGVLAACSLADAMAEDAVAAGEQPPPALATLDIGGTSADVGLARPGRPPLGELSLADGLPLHVPCVDLHTIGCGGGSIARLDAGGALRVGPESAGAVPGPAAYGLGGTEPTVTDAHLVLGHLGAESLLGGGHPVDPDRSRAAIERLARAGGLSVDATARGILDVADVAMARAITVMTSARRLDSARVPLLCFGGAGGLHAARLADRLGAPSALIPHHPGAFSAVGLALAGDSEEIEIPVMMRLDGGQRALSRLDAAVEQACKELAGRAKPELTARMRLVGQGRTIEVPLDGRRVAPDRLRAAFCAAHSRLRGFSPTDDQPVEIVDLRATQRSRPTPFPRVSRAPGTSSGPSRGRLRSSYRVLGREDCILAQHVLGPAVIEEYSGTTLVPAGWSATETGLGLLLTRTQKPRK